MKNVILLLTGLLLLSCKKDNIDIGSLNYNFFENPIPRVDAIFVNETYRSWHNPQCDFYLKGRLDLSSFTRYVRSYELYATFEGGQQKKILGQIDFKPENAIKDFVISTHDYTKDSLKVSFQLYINTGELYKDTTNTWAFPVK